jgi:precorrin-6A synthase
MRELTLIGIGTGNPDHLTLQGAQAMKDADLLLIPRKGSEKSDLAELRRGICDRVVGPGASVVEFEMPRRTTDGDYLDGVNRWHDAVANAWREALSGREELRVAMLIWGDPSLYDSALRIARRLDPVPRLRVIPGITALQALTAAHGIPLNGLGAPVHITTGRRLSAGWPCDSDTVAVLLDGTCAFQSLEPEGITIWWGAYLGMREELLVAGPLAEVSGEIVRQRASARARQGWIMDTYLMRRASRRI